MSLDLAVARVKAKCNKGQTIKLFAPTQQNGYDEAYDDTIEVKAFPIRYQPFNRKIQESVDFSSEVDVLAYVPYSILNNEAYNVDAYKSVEIVNKRYEIYKMQPYSQYDNTFLYWIIGGRKS